MTHSTHPSTLARQGQSIADRHHTYVNSRILQQFGVERPDRQRILILLRRVDRTAVLVELERFSGARLVYANVAPDTVQRIRDALGDPATGPLTESAEPAQAEPDPASTVQDTSPPPPGPSTEGEP